MLKYKVNIVILFTCLILSTTVAWGDGDPFDPWGFGERSISGVSSVENDTRTAVPRAHRENVSLPARVALVGLNFFSEYISQVDGDRCAMYPTCASYSRQVIKKHGFFTGIVMTADRLIHENNETLYAPLVQVGGGMRYYDPVSGNDYWWYSKEGLDK